MSVLTTPAEVIGALGGFASVARLLSQELQRNYRAQNVYGWKISERIGDRKTYPVLRVELEKIGFVADPAIWGFSKADVSNAVEIALGLAEFYGTTDAGKLAGLNAVSRKPRPSRRRQRAKTPSKPSKSILAREGQMRMQL